MSMNLSISWVWWMHLTKVDFWYLISFQDYVEAGTEGEVKCHPNQHFCQFCNNISEHLRTVNILPSNLRVIQMFWPTAKITKQAFAFLIWRIKLRSSAGTAVTVTAVTDLTNKTLISRRSSHGMGRTRSETPTNTWSESNCVFSYKIY